jgi:hypothetical protein
LKNSSLKPSPRNLKTSANHLSTGVCDLRLWWHYILEISKNMAAAL